MFLAYLWSIFNFVVIFMGLPSHFSKGLIDPPPSTAMSSTATDTPISVQYDITPTVMSTSAFSEQSIDPLTLEESISQVMNTIAKTLTSELDTGYSISSEISSQTTTTTEQDIVLWSSTKTSSSSTTATPNPTDYAIRNHKFPVSVIDGRRTESFETVLVTYFAKDENDVRHLLRRTRINVVKYPKNGKHLPPKGLTESIVDTLWLCMLYAFKAIYWVMFAYNYYTFWNKYILQL